MNCWTVGELLQLVR